MRVFIKNIILFTIITLPLYFVFLIFFGEVMPTFVNKNLKYKKGGIGFMDKRIEEVREIKNVDILFIGSSHAYRGYDPRIFNKFGYTAFNLGSSAQTPLTTKYLLDEYIAALNPKYVLLDVYPLLLGNNGIESVLNIVSNSKISNNLVELTLEVNDIQVFNTIFFKFYKETINSFISDNEPKRSKEDKYIGNGFVESYKIYNRDLAVNTIQQKIELNPVQLQKLEDIIFLLKERNIDFYLIQTPITRHLYNSFENNNEIDSILSTKGKYMNYNKIVNFKDNLFIDDNHLNQKGVIIFNNQILKDFNFKK